MTEDELAGSAGIVRTVLPAPGEGGELPTRDGRAMCVPDPVGLASAINAAAVDGRIEFDHQSER